MWETIFEAATGAGIWAVLFVFLFFIQIKDSKAREEKYQATIDALADKLKMIADIKTDIEDIKDKLSATPRKTAEKAENNNAQGKQS